jgi:hypothetical protein
MSLVRHRLAENTLDMCLIFVLPLFRKANVLKADMAGAVEQHGAWHAHHPVGGGDLAIAGTAYTRTPKSPE